MVVVAGSLAFDFVMNFPGRFSEHIMLEKIHVLNLSFLTERLNKNFGGTAGNIAYNLALLGEKPIVLSTAGKDFRPYKKFLAKSGVNTRYIKIVRDDFTSNYFAVVDKLDNQIGGFYAGAMLEDKKLSFKKIREIIDFVVISPTEPEAMINFAEQAQRLAIPYLFDPGMQLPRLEKAELMQGVSGAKILIGNDYEISLIQKKLNFGKKELLKKVDILITTLAEKGSIIETQERVLRVKAARPFNTCDPVGAGDAYRAGFLKGFLLNFDLKTCGQMGAVAAVYTVEKYGTTTHRFTREQFCKRYRNNYKEILQF